MANKDKMIQYVVSGTLLVPGLGDACYVRVGDVKKMTLWSRLMTDHLIDNIIITSWHVALSQHIYMTNVVIHSSSVVVHTNSDVTGFLAPRNSLSNRVK